MPAPFESLTPLGKTRRLRTLAARALTEFGVRPVRLRLLAYETNAVFRVDTADGARYCLRINQGEEHLDQDIEVEVAWLDALGRDTSLNVPAVVRGPQGEPFLRVASPGVPGDRRCTLFSWVPGAPVNEDRFVEGYRDVGMAMATLHRHARDFRVPAHLRPMQWDRVFYFPGDEVVFRRPEYAQLFPPDRLAVMEKGIDLADDALGKLYDSGHPHLLHGDLHPWNMHRARGHLWLFDFEDVTSGFPVQDIAITLFYEQHRAESEEVAAALRSGYEEVEPWPGAEERLLRTLFAARTLNFMNYVLTLWDDPSEYLAMATNRVRENLDL